MVSSLTDLTWDDRFVRALPADPDEGTSPRQVLGAAYSRTGPTPVSAPRLLAWSPDTARLLGLADELVQSRPFVEAMAGNRILDGMQPYSAVYGGHQFGNWAGQLGDGRAITLGELVTPGSQRFELQLKGAGPTPYSRRADGRAVLRSSVREFLCSEAMFHLGVPTTRALTLVDTGDRVVRDMFYDGRPEAEPGAIVCRVAPSFLRFGSFQIHMARDDKALLEKVTAHTLETHFPELGPYSEAAVGALFAEVCARTARMVAHWMRVGFVHGVMNTDNMSMLGLTIDYGPYGWVDNYDPGWTPNLTDAGGRRYRFGQQPQIAAWNLLRLAEAFYPLLGGTEALQAGLRRFEETWNESHAELITGKLGLASFRPEVDEPLWADLQAGLQLVETDMTLFFRGLAEVPGDPEALHGKDDEALLQPLQEAFYVPPQPHHVRNWARWLRRYAARVNEDGVSDEDRKRAMNRVNPKYVLRNYLAQEAIEQAEAGDPTRITELLGVLQRPYDEQPEAQRFAARRPDWARHKAGCSMLSCSS